LAELWFIDGEATWNNKKYFLTREEGSDMRKKRKGEKGSGAKFQHVLKTGCNGKVDWTTARQMEAITHLYLLIGKPGSSLTAALHHGLDHTANTPWEKKGNRSRF